MPQQALQNVTWIYGLIHVLCCNTNVIRHYTKTVQLLNLKKRYLTTVVSSSSIPVYAVI